MKTTETTHNSKRTMSMAAATLAVILLGLTGCSTISRQAVSDSVVIPEFAIVISSEEKPFMMGSDKNGAVYCFNQGMRMELRGYKEEGKIFINPGAIGTHELQHILYCIDPEKYGSPDGDWALDTAGVSSGSRILARKVRF